MKYINIENLDTAVKALKDYSDNKTVEANGYTDKQIEAIKNESLADEWYTID